MATTTINTTTAKAGYKGIYVFAAIWWLMFFLYLPAAKAGLVGDFPGWLDQVTHLSFFNYINRSKSGIRGMYQFTQTCTYLFHLVFGANAWLWHLLHITLHSINCFLLFTICRRLFTDTGISGAKEIALSGVLLYCVCPCLTEVIVWEPSYHYLQGFLLSLLILYWLQQYHYQQQVKYIWYAGIVFFLSTYSLEIFYITPFLVLGMALYYRLGLRYNKAIFRKVIYYFFIPQLVMFALYWVALSLTYGSIDFAHIGNNEVASPFENLSKIAKYIFHILFFGRFFTNDQKHKVYDLLNARSAIITSISIISLLCIYIALKFRRMQPKAKACSVLFLYTLLCLGLITPLWFPDLLLVIYDRYTYFTNGFLFMLLALLLSYIRIKTIRYVLIGGYALVSIYFTHKLTKYWKQSAAVVNNLLDTFPDPRNKTVILLSMPECLNGVQMIGTRDDGEYKLIHNMLRPNKINNTVYDGLSFNMLMPTDGTNVMVLDDSTVRVTLNQWGTWWWYGGLGGASYETPDYKLNLKDPGRMFELTLKKTASNYMLLYEVGDQWHKVDWSKKEIEQD